jgi:DNA-binding XRE family transcriptional regulator
MQTVEVENLNEKMVRLNQKARQQELAEQDRLEELRRKNHDFVQYSRKGLEALSLLNNLLAHKIFLYLSKEMDLENAIVISQQTLAQIFDVSRSTVNIAVKELEDKKLLEIYKIGNTNVYCLNANIVWSTSRDKIETAKFKAQVVISKNEQIRKVKKDKLKQLSLLDNKED